MPGQSMNENRALRDVFREYSHRPELISTMDHVPLVQMMITKQAVGEAGRQRGISRESPNPPDEPASEE